ncbi:MAG TPA: hypothetical protein PKW95_15975 [bacterium]|nr:hypothetical protein [bacterium]
MPEFFQTAMGRTFYDHTLPTIARELARLNAALERIAAALEKQNTQAKEKDNDETQA